MRRLVFSFGLILIASAIVLLGSDRGPSGAATNSEGALIYVTKCVACHRADGRGAGPYPPLAHNPHVTATDTQQLIATVTSGRNGPVTILGRNYGAPMPAQYPELSNAQIAAVLTYIRSAWGNNAPAISDAQIAAAARPVAFSGATIFVTTCGNCHPAGGGRTSLAPPLDGNPHVIASDARAMIGIIVNGMSGPLAVNGITYDSPMPSWHTRLSNADVAAVATYIRSAWSNRASAVTESEVAQAGPQVSSTIGSFIYMQVCAVCHGARGDAPGARLAGNLDVLAADPTSTIRITERGEQGMPGWKGQLSDADVASVLTYIRTSWGNNGSAISEDQVARSK